MREELYPMRIPARFSHQGGGGLATIVQTTIVLILLGLVYALVVERGHPHIIMVACVSGALIGLFSGAAEV
jgi:hypothetical protein